MYDYQIYIEYLNVQCIVTSSLHRINHNILSVPYLSTFISLSIYTNV